DAGVAARINERILKHAIPLKRRAVAADPMRARRHGQLLAACCDVTPNEMQISRGRREDDIVNRSTARNKSLGGAWASRPPERPGRLQQPADPMKQVDRGAWSNLRHCKRCRWRPDRHQL